MTIPDQPFHSLLEAAEDVLARAGFAVLSKETAALMEDIERRIAAGLPVADCEFEAVLFAFWSGPISEYYQPKVYA